MSDNSQPKSDTESVRRKPAKISVASDRSQILVNWTARLVMIIAVSLSLYQLYTAGVTALTALVQRSIHLGAILSLTFLLKPPFKGARKDKLTIWLMLDWIFILASVYCTFYICYNLTDIFERQGDWLRSDLVVSIIGTILVLEACRRVIGLIMTGICLTAMLYAHYGPYMPELIIHKGYSIERIATTLWLTTEGIFGLPIGVAATFVFVFVLFGAFLESTGGGNFFIELAYAITGRFSGGPAKTAVVASGFLGSVSGSAVGNVVATGSFTIPMMKKVGYRPHVAGAIEAAASTGGQLMPPIMGAGAFLMAEFTETSYLTIIKVALVPAIMYYLTVLFFVHYEAKKHGLVGQPRDSLPRIMSVLKEGLHFIIPVLILIYVLVSNYSPMMAGFVAVLSTLAASVTANTVRWVAHNARLPVNDANRINLARFSLTELKMTHWRFGKRGHKRHYGLGGLRRRRHHCRHGHLDRNGLEVFESGAGSELRNQGPGDSLDRCGLSGPRHGVAGNRQLYRPGHPGRTGPVGYGRTAACHPHDRFLVLPGCQCHASGQPGQLRRCRHCRCQSDADGVYFMEAGQRSLHYPHHHGLSPAARPR